MTGGLCGLQGAKILKSGYESERFPPNIKGPLLCCRQCAMAESCTAEAELYPQERGRVG